MSTHRKGDSNVIIDALGADPRGWGSFFFFPPKVYCVRVVLRFSVPTQCFVAAINYLKYVIIHEMLFQYVDVL